MKTGYSVRLVLEKWEKKGDEPATFTELRSSYFGSFADSKEWSLEKYDILCDSISKDNFLVAPRAAAPAAAEPDKIATDNSKRAAMATTVLHPTTTRETFLLGVETGVRLCEKGNNLQASIHKAAADFDEWKSAS